MRKFKGATEVGMGPTNLKGRMILMSVALVGIVAVLFWMQLSGATQPEPSEGPGPSSGDERIVLPALPPGTFEQVADNEERQRAFVEADELKIVRAAVRRTTAGAIADSGAPTLSNAVHARLVADPDAQRGDWFSVRGQILEIASMDTGPGSSETEYVGTLRLDGRDENGGAGDGTDRFVHFRMLRTDDADLARGDWARLGGVFFKVLADEVDVAEPVVAPGPGVVPPPPVRETATGPLLVGPEILRSFEDFGTVTGITQEQWDEVRDDTFNRVTGPKDSMRWRLLAWMRDRPEAEMQAAAQEELDDEILFGIAESGDPYRGRTFKLPVSRVQASTARAAGENPARLDTYSIIWLGNTMWQRKPIICVQVPGGIEDYPIGQYVTGELVFYMNIVYDTQTERHVAPLFVAKSIDVFVPEQDPTLTVLLSVASAFFAALILAMFLLLRRDKKRSEELARQLIERRRARREQSAAGATS
ncbi:hypothetical protein Pla163_35700 [Planctomycetes bacterium Pla163]|uniref:Uncharacterized protein n=1 Tax=Rohdeia mirabilis TaxID=2528008 RepID=A0A518D4M7_9BACT|nr:hypothetical protein Pla163_35700 [Planctomycetes bacterium Pla163]